MITLTNLRCVLVGADLGFFKVGSNPLSNLKKYKKNYIDPLLNWKRLELT